MAFALRGLDVGKSILESYSRVLENLASLNIIADRRPTVRRRAEQAGGAASHRRHRKRATRSLACPCGHVGFVGADVPSGVHLGHLATLSSQSEIGRALLVDRRSHDN
uniref:Uncharacterized protein n=1 Tax=Oryza punctata TaxID=4537 RepID=A0A0E0KM04_ORYPU